MQRIYLNGLSQKDDKVDINDKDLYLQLVKVLRSKVGDEVIFFNGIDFIDFVFVIKVIGKKEISLLKSREIIKKRENIDLNLFQSLPNKMDKIELILQKGTEIGIKAFNFFQSKRSQKLYIGDNKQDRLNKIVIEAVEQSGRNIIPKINFITYSDIHKLRDSESLFFHTVNNNSTLIKDVKIDYSKEINLFVGPEGGWSDNEVLDFENLNFKRVSLGNNILRTETAGIVVGFYIIQNY